MAYCRWSDLNGYCDVYVYEDCHGGWTIHVASKHLEPGAPEHGLECLLKGDYDYYLSQQKAWEEWRKSASIYDIDHPDAGESFNYDSAGECADKLERLAMEGISVPPYVIQTLRDEEKDHG